MSVGSARAHHPARVPSSPGLTLTRSSDPLAAFLGPLFETLLLLNVSGIPLLDKAAEKRWGKRADFRKYRREVATLVPYLY